MLLMLFMHNTSMYSTREFLDIKGLFKLHKCAKNDFCRHSGSQEQFSKGAVKGLVA